jgi:hypothetical protein
VLAACAGGGGAAPSLDYRVPSSANATYLVGDTVTIALQGLGEGMEIGARSAATYDLRYDRSADGVRVTASIENLVASVVVPMSDPISMDESGLEGEFVFELDHLGRATAMSSPQAAQLGAQVFAAPVVAHALFPRLPGRSVAAGDSWVDTVTYSEDGEAGVTEVRSNLTYTVVGDATVEGWALSEITFVGTAEVTQELEIEGASINQASEVEIEGRFRWDASAGLLYDSEMTMEGTGTVRIALLPAAFPTRVRWLTRVRLLTR